MKFLAATASILALFCATPAASAVVVSKVTGVLLPGTDDGGVLGTPGADLTGLPFTYRYYYNDEDVEYDAAGDYFGPLYRASGRIGDFRIGFHPVTGSISGLSPPEGPEGVVTRSPVFPSISAELYYDYDGPGGEDWNQYSTIFFYAPPHSPFQSSFAAGRVDSFERTLLPSGAIPEPSTWLHLLTGLGATGLVLRRRRTGCAPSLAWPRATTAEGAPRRLVSRPRPAR